MNEKNEITPELLKEAAKAAKPLLEALEQAAGRPKETKKPNDKDRKL